MAHRRNRQLTVKSFVILDDEPMPKSVEPEATSQHAARRSARGVDDQQFIEGGDAAANAVERFEARHPSVGRD